MLTALLAQLQNAADTPDAPAVQPVVSIDLSTVQPSEESNPAAANPQPSSPIDILRQELAKLPLPGDKLADMQMLSDFM